MSCGAMSVRSRFKKSPSVQLKTLLQPQQMLIARLNSKAFSHQERLLIGHKLAEFGDPRPGVGLRQDGLPDIAWIEIPQGRLTLQVVDHVFEVKPLRMAKYPVTNSQFRYSSTTVAMGMTPGGKASRRSMRRLNRDGGTPMPPGKQSPDTKPWPFVAGWAIGRSQRFAYPPSGNGSR